MIIAEAMQVDGIHIIGAVVALAGVIGLLFRMLISSKDIAIADLKDQLKDMESQKKSYAEIAAESVQSAVDTTNYYRSKENKPPLIILAPVISESHSPSTAEQRETAGIATFRATLAAVKLAQGQEPRAEPPKAVEPDVV